MFSEGRVSISKQGADAMLPAARDPRLSLLTALKGSEASPCLHCGGNVFCGASSMFILGHCMFITALCAFISVQCNFMTV